MKTKLILALLIGFFLYSCQNPIQKRKFIGKYSSAVLKIEFTESGRAILQINKLNLYNGGGIWSETIGKYEIEGDYIYIDEGSAGTERYFIKDDTTLMSQSSTLSITLKKEI